MPQTGLISRPVSLAAGGPPVRKKRWRWVLLVATGGLVMATMIGLGISPAQQGSMMSGGESGPVVVDGNITVAGFARDGVLFDSGAAFGNASAEIPLSGTADAGAVVQARAVEEQSGTSTPWVDIATANGAGDYSGLLPDVPLSSNLMIAEVRLKNAPSVSDATSTRFGVGHSLAFWGQSELARFTQAEFSDTRSAPTVIDETALQVYYSEDEIDSEDYGTSGRLRGGYVTNATPQSKHAAALSNALAEAYPGVKFSIAMHASGGTSRNQSAAPSGNSRNRPGELAIRDLHAPHPGMEPGVAYSSWFFNDLLDANSGIEFVDEALRFASGKTLSGADDDEFPSHIFPDIYDPAQTVYAMSLHRYDGTNSIVQRMGGARTALRETFATNTNVPGFIREGTSALTYANASGDSAHPVTGAGFEDGMVRLFRHLVSGALRISGVSSWEQPEFDMATLSADRTYIEVWSEAGDITTHRNLAGETPPSGYPEIWGFRHNGERTSASIVDGRVRVLPIEGSSVFADGDAISFASDGAGADPDTRGSLAAEIWKDHPVIQIDGGPPLLEAVPVQAATPQSVLGVIPEEALAPDPNTNPNLATPNFTAAVRGSSGADGWRGDPAVWTFNGDGSFEAQAVSKSSARGTIVPKTALVGKTIELSFVMSSPDLAFGEIYVRVSTEGGGGGTGMFQSSSVPITLNERTTLMLGEVPSANKRLEVEIRRERPVSGTVVFNEVTIKEVTQ